MPPARTAPPVPSAPRATPAPPDRQVPAGAKGDTGAVGPAGPAGQKGDPGAPGVTDAYWYREIGSTDIDYPGAWEYTVVNYMTLPAGKYVVTGKATVVTTHTGPITVGCFLIGYQFGSYVPGSADDSTSFSLNKDVGIVEGTANLTEKLDISATTVLDLKCAGKDASVNESYMTAIKVGNLSQA